MTNALVGLGVRPTSAMGLNFIPNTFVDAFYILLYSPSFSEIVKLVRVTVMVTFKMGSEGFVFVLF